MPTPRRNPVRAADAGAALAVPVAAPAAPQPEPADSVLALAEPQQDIAAPASALAAITLFSRAPIPQPIAAVSPVHLRIGGADGAFARHAAASGSLKAALDALRDDRYEETFKRRNGLKDPLDRKIVDWLLMRSGSPHVTSGMIAAWIPQAGGWPDQDLVRVRSEEALARERADTDRVLAAFGRSEPITISGTRLLARAYLTRGDRGRATALIRDVWRKKRFDAVLEKQIVEEFGALLRREDYLARAEMQLYRDHSKDAARMKPYLSEADRLYVDARAAVSGSDKNADKKLKAVPAAARQHAGYLFARIASARRAERFEEAAALLEKAPRDPDVLIDPDEWWTERRIVSRALREQGDAARAYKIAAGHSAISPGKFADAEFHAGWYALRFLGDPRRAQKHFERVRDVGTTPITVSRGEYWLGRTAAAAGDRGGAARHYRNAARHGSTYYGQLARRELGERSAGIGAVRPTSADRAAFRRNELVRAIEKLAAAGHDHRTWPLFDYLAETLPTSGQIVLLAELAESIDKPHFALNVGKEGLRRGLDVGDVAFPTKAIPRSAQYPPGLDKAVVFAIARQESTFNAGAISPAGARGLLQLMPATAKGLSRKLGVSYSQTKLITDPAYNVRLGAQFLSDLLVRFDGSYVLTFAAYNAGPGRSNEWIKRFGDPRDPRVDAVDWVEMIPFTETRNYVQRVMENMQAYHERLGTGKLTIEADLHRGRAS